MAYGMGMEELPGESKGRNLKDTLTSILSVVQEARKTDETQAAQKQISVEEVKEVLARGQTSDDIDENWEEKTLSNVRAALYGE